MRVEGTNIRTVYILISLFGIGLFLSMSLSPFEPFLLEVTISLPCFLGLMAMPIVCLLIGLILWRKSSWWWIGPALLSCAFIFSIGYFSAIGTAVSDWQFKKHMDDYVRIVDSVKNGTIPCNTNLVYIRNVTNLPPHIGSIHAACCPDGALLVEFHINYGTSLKFPGYLFKNFGETNNCIMNNMGPGQRWYSLRHITNDWYKFSY